MWTCLAAPWEHVVLIGLSRLHPLCLFVAWITMLEIGKKKASRYPREARSSDHGARARQFLPIDVNSRERIARKAQLNIP